MTETGNFVDPNQPLYDLGVSIRDLAYRKLEEECTRKFAPLLPSGPDYISIDPDGTLSVNAGNDNITIEFDPELRNLGISENIDITPIRDSGIFDHIPGELDRFSAKGVAECDHIIASLAEVTGQEDSLASIAIEIETHFQDTKTALTSWSGDAARSFKSFFINPMKEAKNLHVSLAIELRAGVEAQKNLILESEQSAREIGERIHRSLMFYPGTNDPWSVIMPIVGAALTFVSFVALPPVGSLGITMGLLGLANTAANAGKSAVDATTGTTSSTMEIIESLNNAITRLDAQISNETDDIARGLSATNTAIEQALSLGPDERRYIVPVRPSIIDDTPSFDEFKAPST